jgi:large subunit ribosomal protein L4
MQVDVYKIDGTKSGVMVELDPKVFEIEPNDHAIYQAVRSIQANKRQGTHKVKGRSEVSGGGRKPFKQKKTGRARSGSSRSGIWTGGGSIFGPTPHEYSVNLPMKVKRLARKSALSYKAKDGAIKVVEDFKFDEVKTKKMSLMLKALAVEKQKTLLLTNGTDQTLVKSGRNIAKLEIREADKASTFDILKNQVLLIQKGAVDSLQQSLKN